jgi:hypothetical protein
VRLIARAKRAGAGLYRGVAVKKCVDYLRGMWFDGGMNKCTYTGIAEGDEVVRTQGRADAIGLRGTVTTIHGSIAGDTLATVTTSDGETFTCYTRQLKVA